ncbi:hypothetical protein ACFFLM_05890 [Deinococcus oregonensis]|uniref:Uncharacterized protein n=1 Tax=Deinococcus oregonensis TaxID=1805970 RepID=A0ABV6AVH6_9DEIO
MTASSRLEAEPIVAARLRLNQEVGGLLRPMTAEPHYTQILSVVEALIDRVNQEAAPALVTLLEVLVDQVAAYEAILYPPARSTVPNMLAFLLSNGF